MKFGASLKKLIFAATLLVLAVSGLALPAPARAQDNGNSGIVLDSLRIDIWPEYDKPSVLVIYHITLAPETTLPASMSVRIPAAVGQPFAVAIQEPNGLYNLPYEVKTSGEWEDITFITTLAEVRIEYYDPTLVKNGKARNFTFNWPGDYAVNNLSLQVQQPGGATGMVIKPDMGSGAQGEDGLTYYSYLAGKVNAGTTFAVSIAYGKDSDELTSAGQFQAVQPDQPVSESTTGRVTFSQMLPFVLGGAGLLLIAAGVFWYFRSGGAAQPEPGRRRHAHKVEAGDENPSDSMFCHQCGKKSGPGDVFCRSCGTKLK
jgi:hypothetical protein